MILFRPVGLEELRLVYEAGMKAFPPRLPEQPIFYPVTNAAYARQIARDWNTKSGTLAGFVTRFSVDDEYVRKFDRRVVGGAQHEELWVPAEELAEFNSHIVAAIEVTEAYFGPGYCGLVPDSFGLEGKTAHEQFVALVATSRYSGMDFMCEMAANQVAVFLNFFFWQQESFAKDGIPDAERDVLLGKFKAVWAGSPRAAPLGVVGP
ncbi:MAG: hypothetical protein HYV09_00030 [Deltaproteobacteria bacterium]|nr:hypothetical protein [Deltaproteobacteria bacterium]